MNNYYIFFQEDVYKYNAEDNSIHEVTTGALETRGGVCLYIPRNGRSGTKVVMKDSSTKDEIMVSISRELEVFSSELLVLEQPTGDYVLHFYARRGEIEQIFSNYEFSQIIPMPFFIEWLNKTEEENQHFLSGFIGTNFLYLKQISTPTDYANQVKEVVKSSATPLSAEEIAIYTGEQRFNKRLLVDNKYGMESFAPESETLIPSWRDKFSINYKYKILRPVLVASIGIFLITGAFFLKEYIFETARATKAEQSVKQHTKKNNQLKEEMKGLKSKTFYDLYSPLRYSDVHYVVSALFKRDEKGQLVYPDITKYVLSLEGGAAIVEVETNSEESVRRLGRDFSFSDMSSRDGTLFFIRLNIPLKEEEK